MESINKKGWSLRYVPGDVSADEKINNIAKALKVSCAVARLLYNRGYSDAESASTFLCSDVTTLHDPYEMKDMRHAVIRILEAVQNCEKITIYGDYDVDGVTSVTLLYTYISSLGANVDYYIPVRAKEGYGLSSSAIDSLKESGTQLMITVDTGITAVNETEYARSIGIDVVITDHHECHVTQMLWVNLIMDTFGAMALASLPPSPEVMDSKPRDRKAFILNKAMSVDIWGVGLFFFALTLGFLYIFQHAEITCMADLLTLHLGEANKVTPYEQTLLFSIFVWTHFWYMFNARSFETGKSYFKLKQSSGFKTIVGVIIIGQIIIVELLYNFFNVEPMFHTTDWSLNINGCLDWIIIVGLSSLVFWVREAWLLVTKK